MIIHVWMHWFWITSSIKCFLLFAVQMISLSCVLHPYATEAGLLDNETMLFDNVTEYKMNKSSQTEEIDDVTSLLYLLSSASTPSSSASVSIYSSTLENVVDPTVEVVSNSTFSSNISDSDELSSTIVTTSTDSSQLIRNESDDSASKIETSDVEDTFNGGVLDVYQYPAKKVRKFSHFMYNNTKTEANEEGKKTEEVEVVARANGEPEKKENEIEEVVQNEKSEIVKIVKKEKIKIDISTVNEGSSVGSTKVAEVTESAEPSNISSSTGYALEMGNKTVDNKSGEVTEVIPKEIESKDSSIQSDNVTTTSNQTWTNQSQSDGGLYLSEGEPLDDQGEVENILKNDSLVIENKIEETVIRTTVEPFLLRNRVAAATSTQNFELNQSGMNAGSVTGITLSILVVFGLFGVIVFVLYRRRYLNKPQVLHDKCSNLDSSGYIDDASLRDNSEEMYSLDNDSFLNSLEAMTIQNYWTESVKHTKL